MHILLITCDELRRDALNCYGGKAVQTPHLNALAQQSVRFDQAYTTSPLCLPARCSILTGLYPHRSGAYSNFRKCPLDGDIPNIFNQLHTVGYTNGYFGKCHFAPVPYETTRPDVTLPYDDFREYYVSLGIDHLALQDGKMVSAWFYDDYSKELDAAGYLAAYRACVWDKERAKVFPFPAPAEWHPDAWVGRKAAEYIGTLDGQAPTFTWVSFGGPHYPFDAPEAYRARVDTAELPGKRIAQGELDGQDRIHHTSYFGGGRVDGAASAKDRACMNYSDEYWHELQWQYYANVALIDDKVGDILAAAKASFGEDVLVLFTADHGEMLGHHGLWGKHDCAYDDVWQLPFLLREPGLSAGQSDALVNSADILPTILRAAGAAPVDCDGTDLRTQLQTSGHAYTFSESEGFMAVTDGRQKLIHVQKPAGTWDEFLDRARDPGELYNLIGEPALQADIARLRGAMIEHMLPKVLP